MVLPLALVALIASAVSAFASQDPPATPPSVPDHNAQQDLTGLSIEDLMKVEITTPARKQQQLIDTPSAVFVINAEDIRRSGAQSIPELLRMAPGVQVAQLDASKWAVSARGFNGRFSNKLEVLMDGRSVYTPLFSGVYWEVQDTLLEDIERIEVIRGPGATMWGSNAVNGVINIITKPATDTQGAFVAGGVGTQYRDFAGARYGGAAGDAVHYRAYAKYFDNVGFNPGHDDWWMARAGFRMDSKPADAQTLTAIGDVYDGRQGERVTIPALTPPFSQSYNQHVPVRGGDLLARWMYQTPAGSSVTVQTYYESTLREGGILNERRDTIDVSADHHFSPISRHDLVWGGEFRFTRDNLNDSDTVIFNPLTRDAVIASGFLQDDITLMKERLRLALGSKFEYNTFSRRETPVEVEPSVRATWTPDPAQAIWAAVSRAVRTPSRGESDARLNVAAQPGPTEIALVNNFHFEPEKLIALELGYRVQPMNELSVDLASFYNLYDDLQTFEPSTPFLETSPAPPHAVQPLVIDNKMSGRTYGVEVALKVQPTAEWRLQAAYTFLMMHLIPESDSRDPAAKSAEHESPRNQLYVRSSWDLLSNLQLDVIPRYVDALSSFDVPAYVELDARMAWRPWKTTEVSLTGQNLIHRRHLEFQPALVFTEATQPERGGYLMVTVRF
jgi:iron complex outermembrane receptor protein